MTITVTRSAKKVLRASGGSLLFTAADIEGGPLLSAVEQAISMLKDGNAFTVPETAVPDIAYVSHPLSVPGGVVVTIDSGGLDVAGASALEQILVEALTRSGVRMGSISTPSAQEPHYVNPPKHGVLLWMAGDDAGKQRRDQDRELEEAATNWLYSRLPSGVAEVTVGGALVPMRMNDARGFLRRNQTPIRIHADPDVDAVRSAFSVVVAGRVGFSSSRPRTIGMSQGGAELTEVELVSAATAFRDLAVHLSDMLSWAAVDITPDGEPAPWLPIGREFTTSPDSHLGSAHWWQLMTAGHLQRFHELPRGLVRLSDHASAIQFGEPREWLEREPARSRWERHASAVLSPALAPLVS